MRTVSSGSNSQSWQLTLPAEAERLDQVLEFLNKCLEGTNCSPELVVTLEIAVEEIFVNIAHYAYTPGVGEVTLNSSLKRDPLLFSMEFVDRGIPYNPLAKKDPDITLNAEDRQIGGLGIYMVRQSMDRVFYEHRNGENHFTIEKQLDQQKTAPES